jgi:small subunit ribosomal protein S6
MEATQTQGSSLDLSTAIPAPNFPEGTKLREYETIFALKPDLADEVVERYKERIRSLIHREGGKAIKFTIWGKKKAQYELAKQTRAIYVHVVYLGGSKIVAEIERNLRMSDDVVRYQSIKLAEETDASKPVEQDVKLAGDVDQAERPPREERERRDDFGGDLGGGGDFDGDEGESA